MQNFITYERISGSIEDGTLTLNRDFHFNSSIPFENFVLRGVTIKPEDELKEFTVGVLPGAYYFYPDRARRPNVVFALYCGPFQPGVSLDFSLSERIWVAIILLNQTELSYQACPCCGQNKSFRASILGSATVNQDGEIISVDKEDCSVDEDCLYTCPASKEGDIGCGYQGPLGDFLTENWKKI